MTKAKNIRFTLVSLLVILLLCEVSVASPTFSFVGVTRQSESTGLSKPNFTARNIEQCLGEVTTFYRSMEKQGPSDTAGRSVMGVVPLFNSPLKTSTNWVSSGWKKNSSYKNPVIAPDKESKWKYRAFRAKKRDSTISGWHRSTLSDGYLSPGFPGDGPTIDVPETPPVVGDSAVVPAPAAISLGCVGLAIVGWLRNRKTF